MNTPQDLSFNIPEQYNEVREYSIKAHNGQKYAELPYVFHLDYVFSGFMKFPIKEESLLDFGFDKSELLKIIGLAIYTHDVIEDTKITREDLAFEFNQILADGVSNLSNIEGKNRKETISLTNQKYSSFKTTNIDEYIALLVKPYDRWGNFHYSIETKNKRMAKLYFDEYRAFRKAVYREGIAEDIWKELDSLYSLAKSEFGFLDLGELQIEETLIKKYKVRSDGLDDIDITIDSNTLTVAIHSQILKATWNNRKSLASFIVSNDEDYLISSLNPWLIRYEPDYVRYQKEMRQWVIENRSEEVISKDLARELYNITDWRDYVTENPYEPIKNPCSPICYDEFKELEFEGFDVPDRITAEWLYMTKIVKVVKETLRRTI